MESTICAPAAFDNRRAALHVLKLFANRRIFVAQRIVVRPRHHDSGALCLQNGFQPLCHIEIQPLFRRAAHPPDCAAVVSAVPRIQRNHITGKLPAFLNARSFFCPLLRPKGLHSVFPGAGKQQRRTQRAGREPRPFNRSPPHGRPPLPTSATNMLTVPKR